MDAGDEDYTIQIIDCLDEIYGAHRVAIIEFAEVPPSETIGEIVDDSC